MASLRYLDTALAENEVPVYLPAPAANLDAVHIFDELSVLAINSALASGRPLLVRGEPGVGKSQLARAAAKQLNRAFLQYTVDIQTESQDLLWHFDAVSRLARAQVAGALASRIAGQASPSQKEEDVLEEHLAFSRFLHPGPLWWAFNWGSAEQQAKCAGGTVPAYDEGTDPANGCVLLIDEIDKAETDVPNGLLEALGAGQFKPEGRREPIFAQKPFPLVVITTNEERALPDAFLRRCMVLNLELPLEKEKFIELLVKRGERHFRDVEEEVRQIAAEQLYEDRKNSKENGLRPLPGQAEYMDLLRALHNLCPQDPVRQSKLLKKIGRFALNKHRNSY